MEVINLFKKYNIELNEEKKLLFNNYYNFLVKKNNDINLTSITEYDEVWIKHFLDSVLIYSEIEDNSKILDIGTGAGFPGVPLKIINESLKVTLLDSLNKRINFLNELIDLLKLKDIKTIHSRAEEYVNVSRETFDYVVSRAVAKLPTLLEYCLPYVKVGGYFIAYKSLNVDDEVAESENALKVLGGVIDKEKSKVINLEGNSRTLLFIKKVKNTPNKYPRGQNKPKTQPL